VSRGTTNRNARGNTDDRASRRRFLLTKHGDGQTCPCYRCETTLTEATLTVDRIVPGVQGGRYTRDNIRPACGPCNSETGGGLSGRGSAA
jgi:5-methylcytosine-specific restriction endonuclease McrA